MATNWFGVITNLLISPWSVRGATNWVSESADYQLVYSLDIPTAPSYPANVTYDVDLRAGVTNFDRVAYYFELQETNGVLDYLWTSMNAFTTNVNQIGVPTAGSGAVFQQPVTNLNVCSSYSNILVGTGLSGGVMEFWPGNYTPANALGVTNASSATDNWGDTYSGSGNYGSMQLANAAASQMLFSFNGWGGNGGNADLGFGNNPDLSGNPDWTGEHNAAGYVVKSLQVYVLPQLIVSSPHIPPTLAIRHNGANLEFSGANGTPLAGYVILSSTNPAVPLSSWTPVVSNSLDTAGAFAWTNALDNASARFFRVLLP